MVGCFFSSVLIQTSSTSRPVGFRAFRFRFVLALQREPRGFPAPAIHPLPTQPTLSCDAFISFRIRSSSLRSSLRVSSYDSQRHASPAANRTGTRGAKGAQAAFVTRVRRTVEAIVRRLFILLDDHIRHFGVQTNKKWNTVSKLYDDSLFGYYADGLLDRFCRHL